MKLEHLLLGLIAERPSTGYDIKKILDVNGRFLRSKTTMSQVYRSLGRMTDDGWVAYAVDERPGAQDAKIYRVTAEGMTVFLEWLTGPYTPPTRFQDPELTARLAFAGFMSAEQVIALLDMEIETRRSEVARFRFRDRTPHLAPTAPFDTDFYVAVAERLHRIGADAIDAHIEAMERLRNDLLDGRLGGDSTPSPASAPAPLEKESR